MIADGTVTAHQLRTVEEAVRPGKTKSGQMRRSRSWKNYKPNLLLLHLLTLDDTNHEYGPMSEASFTAMALLDSYVKRIMDALERTGISRNATLLILSDHGFRPIKQKLHPNVLLRGKGLLRGTPDRITGDVWALATGGTAMVYASNPSRKKELIAELRMHVCWRRKELIAYSARAKCRGLVCPFQPPAIRRRTWSWSRSLTVYSVTRQKGSS